MMGVMMAVLEMSSKLQEFDDNLGQGRSLKTWLCQRGEQRNPVCEVLDICRES